MTAFDVRPASTSTMDSTQANLKDESVINPEAGSPAAAPKKRRRRTAATGAADDCFTCRSRHVKCDRKRPYCGQCLEMGKDCSGYKTTLTWGVGVASRGKLRGLSLPVAENTKGGGSVAARRTSAAQRRKSSISRPPTLATNITRTDSTLHSPSVQSNNYASPDLISPSIHHEQHLWQPSFCYPNSGPYSQPIHDRYDDGKSTSSLGTLQDNQSVVFDNTSPISTTHALQDHNSYNNFSQESNSFPVPAHGLSSGSDAAPEERLDQFQEPFFASNYDQKDHGYDNYDNDSNDYNGIDMSLISSQNAMGLRPEFTFQIPRAFSTSQFSHLPMRMQYLLDYYDKNICSVLVAFDDSINP